MAIKLHAFGGELGEDSHDGFVDELLADHIIGEGWAKRLHLRDDLAEWGSRKAVVEELDGLDDLVHFRAFFHKEGLVLDVAFVGNEHRGSRVIAKRDDLNAHKSLIIDALADDDGCEVGHLREDLTGLFHDFLDALGLFAKDVLKSVFGLLFDAACAEVIDIVLIAFLGWHASAGSMRLLDETHFFKGVHLVADGRAADVELVFRHQGLAANRLSVSDEILDYKLEDFVTPGHLFGLLFSSHTFLVLTILYGAL